MNQVEERMRAEGWVRSVELLEWDDSKILGAAIKALDERSYADLVLDFKSDMYRFFNRNTGQFRSGRTWKDLIK